MACYRALAKILTELIDGAAPDGAYVLNPEDEGLLRALDRLSFEEASFTPENGGASIVAHVEHLRYGLSLLNRWSQGEKPFDYADWTTSWQILSASALEWRRLRQDFRREVYEWKAALGRVGEISQSELNAVMGSVVHLAYHMGAIRQINRDLRGPSAIESQAKELSSPQLG